jgi:DNA helicase-2/ATP-dependent DNA helicase PcrA
LRNVVKIYIACDDDQAIYQWSGADVDYFLNLNGDIEILKQSYRLPDSILKVSKHITSLISNRVKKDYKSTGKEGDVIRLNDVNELHITKNESWLFLSRNNIYLDSITEYISSKGIPFKLKGKLSISKNDIELIKLYQKVKTTRVMDSREERKLRPHLKDNYNLQFNWYDSFNWGDKKIYTYRDYFKNKINMEDYNVSVNTIHATKGSEADNVVLLLDITTNVDSNFLSNPDSEHRVFYVGATRARNKLFIVNSNSYNSYKLY